VALDVDAVLRRIRLAAPPPPTAAGLLTLHRAYVARVPYEDLAIHLGEVVPLTVEHAAARILRGGRGGYCFEVNGVLAALLEALGFDVERREARVGARDADGPTNHLALVVHDAGGAAWLAEAGYGEGWTEPLPLRPGRHMQGPLDWTLEPEPGGGWWVGQHGWGSTPGIAIGAGGVGLDAFAPHHERLSRAPDSPFVQTLVVQRPHRDRIETLRARTLSVVGPAHAEARTLADVADLAAALRGRFGIDPAALGPARMDRLWTRACAQHERWRAA
jgi:N-hydroxyarylamine O-acetyltransferase